MEEKPTKLPYPFIEPHIINSVCKTISDSLKRDLKYRRPFYRKEIHKHKQPKEISGVVSGTVYLISEDRFEINPSQFCKPLIDIFKTISSKKYDPKSKLWSFSIDSYEELMSKVSQLAPSVVLGPLPPFVLKVLKEETIDLEKIDLLPIDPIITNKLLDFQKYGVRFAIAHKGRCIIADDMGLGKTYQALAVASYYRHNFPLLIVTTSSMRETWLAKVRELLLTVARARILTLTSSKDSELVGRPEFDVVITSYKIATMHADSLKSKKFGVVILDESHNLKSTKAQCTRAVASVARLAARVVLLSGTPALSRPVELYTQLTLIEPDAFSYVEYGKRYCNGKMTSFGWDMSGQSHLAELQVLLQKKFLIRRTKEQVLTLGEKTRESVILDKGLLQFTKQDEVEMSKMANEYKSSNGSDKHSALVTFFSETARVKIPAVRKYIAEVLNECPSQKFLVFAHHRAMIEAVCETLDEADVRYVCISGSTPAASRPELVERFQSNESCRCAVLSVTAAGAGITLTAASLVIFAELHWNPGVLSQAESRAHRIGSAGGVCARYLLAPATADDLLWPMLQRKLNVLNDVGLSGDTMENTTTKYQGTNRNNITRYMEPSVPRNYIPGTNIPTNKNTEFSSTGNFVHDLFNFPLPEYCRFGVPDVDLDAIFFNDSAGDLSLGYLDY